MASRSAVAHGTTLEALGICINVCGALSLLSSLLVGLTIVYYGIAKRRVSLKAVGNIAFATTGYSLFWLLPRQRRANLAAVDFGGFPGKCDPHTMCDSLRCPAEALLNFFSIAILLFEILLVALAATFLLRWNQRKVARWFRWAALACWAIAAAVGLGFGVYCDAPIGHEDQQLSRRDRAMRGNRTISLAWLALAIPTAAAALFMYCGPLQRIYRELRLRHFPGTEEEYFWTDVQRLNRRTLLSNEETALARRARPLLVYLFAFLALSIPMGIYVTWAEVNLSHDIGAKAQDLENRMRSGCMVVLASRGLWTVCLVFFLNPRHWEYLTLRQFRRRWRVLNRSGRVNFSEGVQVQNGYTAYEEPETTYGSNQDGAAAPETQAAASGALPDASSGASPRISPRSEASQTLTHARNGSFRPLGNDHADHTDGSGSGASSPDQGRESEPLMPR